MSGSVRSRPGADCPGEGTPGADRRRKSEVGVLSAGLKPALARQVGSPEGNSLDFAWTEEQEALRRSVIQFAQKELASDVIEEDRRQEFSWDGWEKCVELGIQGLPAPEEYGGGDADILTTVCAFEALGYGCGNNGLIFSIGAGKVKADTAPAPGPGSQSGQPGAATAERAGDSSLVRARQDGARWILSGSAGLVSNAGLADLVIVFARADSQAGKGDTATFIVEKSPPGFTVGPTLETMGLRTSPAAEIRLAECEVPEENRFGGAGSGPAALRAGKQWGCLCILAGEVGMMQRQLEASARYAAERTQFGQPIGKFPAVATKVADMEIRLEASRLLLYKAAWLAQQGKDAERETAIAKAYGADAVVQSCRDAVQIHRGYGYMTEYQIERDLRDALVGNIYTGSTDAQKMTIAGLRGL